MRFLVAGQLELSIFASIPGELLVPELACVDELVDNPVVFGANFKLNYLFNLPGILDIPLVGDCSCLVESHLVVVSKS